METAVGTANWLLGKVIKKLSEDLVAAYVSSSELGLNFQKIKTDLNFTLGLLHEAQGRDVSNNPGLQGLLEDLSKKADEAEDALDELHYFMIQDELDGTREATPDLGGGLGAQALHARHAARNTAGNWFSCFSVCCRSQDAAAVTGNTSKAAKSFNHVDSEHADDKLIFDRVAMSNKIKHLIEDMHSLCPHISELLKINTSSSIPPKRVANSLERPAIGSTIRQDKLYGRSTIFEQTVNHMTSGTCSDVTLSVLPIVGPGGIGKTTFTQHLYNDKRTEEHFAVRVWVCVSTNFDVLNLTKEIRSCIPAGENEGETDNLDQLQKSIAKRLKSKRFLIVLDDIWQCSEDKWINFLAPFTVREAEKGSMVIVTTRFPYIAQMVKTTNPVNLEGLEPAEFWVFFQACVFGEVIAEHDKEELIDIARQISNKLKCSPLAAKTVGRLLKKRFSQEHWMEILQKKEWLNQTHDDDIMPALKISYNYLPFHLQKCFSYCALFPEDYKFDSLEISRFWISIGIIDSCGQNDKIEDVGSKYLDELLDNGFLMKGDDNYYVMHDLMHELAQVVSSKECAYIICSSFSADNIQSSIHHLSILMQNNYIENFGEEMDKLKRRLDIGNLRSLMIFGEYRRASLGHILKDTFQDIKCLRVLFIFMNSLSSLPQNFSKLFHLRYLKLKSPDYSDVCLPSTVPRFHHLKFLDVQHFQSSCNLPKDISCLVNLQQIIVGNEKFHSNVPEVGKMKLLQELKEFHVKKESAGFELRELGQLVHLGGKLSIHGLENVRSNKEAAEARLMTKRDLIKLALVWSRKKPYVEDDILADLQPHSNLRSLCVVNHGGPAGPSWLCGNIHMKNLETLHLEGVSWSTLPPFGQMYHLRKLKLKNIVGICQFGPDFIGGITEKSFTRLKEVQLLDMPELVEWVGGVNTHLFSRLERIRCTNCPMLTTLPFSRCCSSNMQDNTIWFPNLRDLFTDKCPRLSLPPLPHTPMLSSFRTDSLLYGDRDLFIYKMAGELAFHNLGEVEGLIIDDASLILFTDLQKLHPLRSIEVRRCDDTFVRGLDDDIVLYSVQSLNLSKFPLTRKSLSDLFKCFPGISHFYVAASNGHHDEEVVLQFPPSSSLKDVCLHECKNLILPMEDGDEFQSLLSLESVSIYNCSKLLSRWSTGEAAQSINPFPPHAKELCLQGDPSTTVSMALFSNLTDLTTLALTNCKNFTMDGFNPLITSNLENLMVFNSRDNETDPYSIAADLLAEVARTKTMPTGSFQLVELYVDSISAVLVASICTRLSLTLRELWFWNDWRAESFTDEQEQALQLLTSLQRLNFTGCRVLLSLPQGLHSLSSLENLNIQGSPRIGSLPKMGLPDSLRWLDISDCWAELYEECQKLRATRPDIDITARLSTTGRLMSNHTSSATTVIGPHQQSCFSASTSE